MNLSFAGCGFNGIYHVGVASCFREYCPQVGYGKISGASVGAIAAAAMACNISLGESTSEILKVAIKGRSRALGPFHPTFDVNKIITDALVKALPADAHKRVNGRLHISVTRVSDGKNVILSQFDSKEDLIQAVLCSCFIPMFSGIFPPKFHGVSYMDGGLSNNLLVLDDNTITVSPFSGESDICPQDPTCNILQVYLANTSIAVSPTNIYRLTRILFPPHPDIMAKMCQQGFDDALRFLQRNNKISCLRCVAIQTSFMLAPESDSSPAAETEIPTDTTVSEFGDSGIDSQETQLHEYDGCADCQSRRDMAELADSLPDPVARAIQDACDQVNKGVVNWIFKHRPVRVLSLLTVPYVLPFDITIVALRKLWRAMPWIKTEMNNSLHNLLTAATKVVNRMESKRHYYSAKFSCQLAVTEYDYSSEDQHKIRTPIMSKKHSVISRKSSSPNLVHQQQQHQQLLQSSQTSPNSPCGRGLTKSNSFGGRRISSVEDIHSRNSFNAKKLARKSYAGSEFILSKARDRRKSMFDGFDGSKQLQPPERVISKMNFGFSLQLPDGHRTATSTRSLRMSRRSEQDLGETSEETAEYPDAIAALKNLSAEDSSSDKEPSVLNIANRALYLERDSLGVKTDSSDGFDEILETTSHQDAVMAFHYLDENNRVNITEIFNIKPDSGLSQEQLDERW